MRRIIQKLGPVVSVIVVTLFSVVASVSITLFIFYLRQDDTGMMLTVKIAIIVPLIVAPLASVPLVRLILKIDRLEKEMRALATYDYLTGILSRRAFLHDARRFIDFNEREHIVFSVVALDIDHFKKINDNYGHAAGDAVLKDFSTTVKTIIRKSDLFGRIGGEEFALLLPRASEDTAYTLSLRLHSAIRESVIQYDQSTIKYTVSMGLVANNSGESDKIENIIRKADKALYLAKEKGRNCTIIFDDEKTAGP